MLVRILVIFVVVAVVGGALAVQMMDLPANTRVIETNADIDAEAALGGS